MSALELLQHDELVVLILKDGKQREGKWDTYNWRFLFTDCWHPAQNIHCSLDDVEEWIPAAKF